MTTRAAFTAVSFILGLALGVALALSFGRASEADAQEGRTTAPIGAAAPVAIAPGPGGMWIVYGNRLRVCVAGPLPAGIETFTPDCGEAVSLY